MSIEIIAVLVGIPGAIVALIALIKWVGTVKTWATGISAISGRMAHRVTVIYQNADRRIAITKRKLGLHWTIWRKKVRVNIKFVLDQDKTLRDASATENERVGMAAISLSAILSSGAYFPDETHKQVFGLIKSTDTERFHMLCARIADDVVTNTDIQVDASGTFYVVPWDSVLERFFRYALDEPPANESGGTAKSP